jgi:hypothetical protein
LLAIAAITTSSEPAHNSLKTLLGEYFRVTTSPGPELTLDGLF